MPTEQDTQDQPVLILPLSSIKATLTNAGGKGANLAELSRAGFKVPPGFIVTTDAYRAYVKANGIDAKLIGLVGSTSTGDPARLESVSQAIRDLFSAGTLPDEIVRPILSAYTDLSSQHGTNLPVAVRSSATAEDLPGLSFAGQQDTYLNIMGIDALIQAVKSCWGSLWTARAMAYRARNHISHDDVALAVVVQAMVPSEVSGVLFTANPLTGNRGEIVIDATYGLGEALVSGQVEPDHYVVGTRTMRITSRKLGAKAIATLPLAEGGTQTASLDQGQQQALLDAQIIELSGIAVRVAEHFGTPQDIEWAWAGGQLSILQSRPITSLYPLPDSILHSDHLRALFSLNMIQGIIEPFTPMAQDVVRLLLSPVLRAAGVRRNAEDIAINAGERLYLDVTDLMTTKRLRPVLLAFVGNTGPGARDVFRNLIASGRVPTISSSGGSIRRFFFGFRTILAGILIALARPTSMRSRAFRKADQYYAEFRQSMQRATTFRSRMEVINQDAPLAMRKIFFVVVPVLAPGMLTQGLVDRWLRPWAGAEPGTVRLLLRGAPGNVTTEMDLKLWATAQTIRADDTSKALLTSQPAEKITQAYLAGELPPVAQKAIKGFLDEYGMRAVGEIDIGNPRWREDPRSIIQTLCSYLQIDDPNLAPDHVFQTAAAGAEKLTAEYIALVRRRGGPLRGAIRAHVLTLVMRRMRILAVVRETPKFYIIKLFDVMRRALLDSGRELAAQGALDKADDVFFVPLDTLLAVSRGESADLKAIVAQKHAAYDRELNRRQIPQLLLSTGEAFYQGASAGTEGANVLLGDGVSPGTVEGTVHVIRDPRGVRLEPGEILVCPATDPGWTPLFLSAGGLVMELGGMVTHGSVVAREYGVPAVVGVRDATQRLHTGQRVRVDGSTGRVVVLGQATLQNV